MRIIDDSIFLTTEVFDVLSQFANTTRESFCIIDIETTGLSASISSLYLIGALWFNPKGDKTISTRQWFADDYKSEKDILLSFGTFLKKFKTVVTYNGDTFDIPFLKKKYKSHKLQSPFDSVNSIDTYSQIRHIKNVLNCDNLKLITVEKLVGFRRQHDLSGKDCVSLYSKYMQNTLMNIPEAVNIQDQLLFHNIEDIIGTYQSSLLLGYFLEPEYEKSRFSTNHLNVKFTNKFAYPINETFESEGYSLTFNNNSLILRTRIKKGILYHFFEDYKHYYYLPNEDMAIHKSVGQYVDSSMRQQAKASNCYTKYSGSFIRIPYAFTPSKKQLLFTPEYKSKHTYLALSKEDNSEVLSQENVKCLCELAKYLIINIT